MTFSALRRKVKTDLQATLRRRCALPEKEKRSPPMNAQTTGRPLTAFHLKCIALAAMIVDHAAAVLVPVQLPVYTLLRGIGRIAFPIYAFFIAEGCRRTRSRERYLLRLGMFALISEIPFDLAFYPQLRTGVLWKDFLNSTNIFYTLFFAVACIHIWETLRRQSRPLQLAAAGTFCTCLAFWAYLLFNITGNGLPYILMILLYLACFLTACHVLEGSSPREPDRLGNILCILPLLPIFFLSEVVDCDYSVFGVVLICLLYLAKDRNWQTGVLALGLLYEYGWEGWLKPVVLWRNDFQWAPAVSLVFALLAVVLLCFYNGKRGRNIKWAFYGAYPVHIAILALLRVILGL